MRIYITNVYYINVMYTYFSKIKKIKEGGKLNFYLLYLCDTDGYK